MKNSMKAIMGLVAAAIVLGGASGLSYLANRGDTYIGTVNGQQISRAQYDQSLDQLKKQYTSRFGLDFNTPEGKQMLVGLQRNLVNQLEDRTLLLQEAKKRNITVSDAEVKAKIDALRQGRFPDDASFQKALQQAGLTLPELQDQIRSGLTMQKLMAAVVGPVKVSDQQIADFYQKNTQQFTHPEEIRASHILVKTKAQAEAIEQQLKHGASFAKLAEQNSLDPGSKVKGGDLGYFHHGQMVPAFDKAAFALKDGQISAPIKTNFGYHVIERTGTKPAGTEPLAKVKDEIRTYLVKQQEQQRFAAFVAGLKSKAVIAILPQYQPTVPAAAAAPAPATAPATPGAPKTAVTSNATK